MGSVFLFICLFVLMASFFVSKTNYLNEVFRKLKNFKNGSRGVNNIWFENYTHSSANGIEDFENWILKNELFSKHDMGFIKKMKEAINVINDTLNQYEQVLVSSNGGKESIVLLDLIALTLHLNGKSLKSENEKVKVFSFLQDHSFPSIVDHITNVQVKRYNVPTEIVQTNDFKQGLSLLKNKYPNHHGIYLGVRKTDPTGKFSDTICETTEGWPKFVRIHPLFLWNYHDVWRYLIRLNVPYPDLYDRGYTSIGTVEDTKPNPELKWIDKDGTVQYKPAFHLIDETKERNGR